MSSRFGLRFLSTIPRGLKTASLKQTFQRRITTTAEPNIAPQNQGYAARLWNSPVGPKTVHFWAPIMKWGVVLTGVSDFARPAENLSLTQNLALVATGAIWTRWCFVIRPQNYFLAAVNFFLFIVGSTQVSRIYMYNRSVKGASLTDDLKGVVHETEQMVGDMVKDPQASLKEARRTGD